jgi:hypothetical protein
VSLFNHLVDKVTNMTPVNTGGNKINKNTSKNVSEDDKDYNIFNQGPQDHPPVPALPLDQVPPLVLHQQEGQWRVNDNPADQYPT